MLQGPGVQHRNAAGKVNQKRRKGAGEVAQWVECFPSIPEAMGAARGIASPGLASASYIMKNNTCFLVQPSFMFYTCTLILLNNCKVSSIHHEL